MTRAKTIQPTASRRLTMGVTSSMPSKSPRPGTTKQIFEPGKSHEAPLTTRNINPTVSGTVTGSGYSKADEDKNFFHTGDANEKLLNK